MSRSKDTAVHAHTPSGFSRIPLSATVSPAERGGPVTHPCRRRLLGAPVGLTDRGAAGSVPCAAREVLTSCPLSPRVSGAHVSIPSSGLLPQPLLPRHPSPADFFRWPALACSHNGKGIWEQSSSSAE
ncbi:unnamed protein product [Rangifer tarandus platyrhynchus]|uniref:Uncharacterized protein n=2 Tax=Rangifer tarandus platyrhynchus TaxID=3082113 RepID=A0ABN8ZQH7_RANTA|nr:unnamed protein product [Rangifer tarandus platyrhynchus]CAI9709284.1 unnamed protein product [Rangifer tarandus platyrhynchus]